MIVIVIVIARRARGVGEGEGEGRDEREDEVETRHRGVEVPCGEERVDAGASRAEVWAFPEKPPKNICVQHRDLEDRIIALGCSIS